MSLRIKGQKFYESQVISFMGQKSNLILFCSTICMLHDFVLSDFYNLETVFSKF